jgi:hypothetical protein
MRKDCAVPRRQEARDNQVEGLDWKSRISEILQEMNIASDTFTGDIAISFKEGGISWLERREIFK